MFNQKNGAITILLSLCLLTFVLSNSLNAQDSKNWQIMLTKELAKDEAIKVAVNDLKETAELYDIKINVIDASEESKGNLIVVGSPERNKQTKKIVRSNSIKLNAVDDPQGYEIITTVIKNNRIIIISGGSVIGDVYGLFWVLDRLKVHKEIPEINDVRIPKMKIRFTGGGSDEEAMRNALRVSATWVNGRISVNSLVPWNSGGWSVR